MSDKIEVLIQGVDSVEAVPGLDTVADLARFTTASTRDELEARIGSAEVMLGWNFRADDLQAVWPEATRLRWVHWNAAGVDAVLFPGLVESDVVLTNARGIFDRAMAEYVLGLVLAMAKGFVETFAAKRERRWAYRLAERVHGQRALVVGAGSIGREIARSLSAMGIAVEGVGRTARAEDADFSRVHAVADLDALLEHFDIVVLIAPLTEHTRGLFGRAQFERMATHARFINVGRGQLIDETALAEALENDVIAGAALDVLQEEPLPATSLLWDVPNLIISPHMSGDYHGCFEDLTALFLDNLHRYKDGRPLRNQVDKTLGFARSDS